MGKNFDELSKAFARGESRRTALKRFATGAAGAFLATIPFRGAEANVGKYVGMTECNRFCREEGFKGAELATCVSECVSSGADRMSQCPDICSDAGFEGAEHSLCVAECSRCVAHKGEYAVMNYGPICID